MRVGERAAACIEPDISSITGDVRAWILWALRFELEWRCVASRKRRISNRSIVNAFTMRTPRIVSSSSVAMSAIRSCDRCVVPRRRRPKWMTGMINSGATMRTDQRQLRVRDEHVDDQARISVIDSWKRSPIRVDTAAWIASASETTRLTISPVERSEKKRWLCRMRRS